MFFLIVELLKIHILKSSTAYSYIYKSFRSGMHSFTLWKIYLYFTRFIIAYYWRGRTFVIIIRVIILFIFLHPVGMSNSLNLFFDLHKLTFLFFFYFWNMSSAKIPNNFKLLKIWWDQIQFVFNKCPTFWFDIISISCPTLFSNTINWLNLKEIIDLAKLPMWKMTIKRILKSLSKFKYPLILTPAFLHRHGIFINQIQ